MIGDYKLSYYSPVMTIKGISVV